MIDNIIHKLLFIDFTSINITENDIVRTEITETQMVSIDYENRFNSIFSHLNKFINNDESSCELYNTYYTIHSKKYNKLIENNNIVTTLDLTLNKSGSGYILKDKYSKINQISGNSKFYLSNNGCNSYVIYNSYKNIVLENNFQFIELDKIGISLNDILEDPNNNKEYHINLKYNKEKNLFFELNENCAITKSSNKLKIQNKSLNEKIAKHNTYYIYNVKDTETNLFDIYKTQVGLSEIILEDDIVFNIIPINSISERTIQINTAGVLTNTDLSLIPIDKHSDQYLIRNSKNEYLKTNSLIDYKKPLRVSLDFVQTNRINMDFIFYIKNNVENLENVNIKNSNKMCMSGGQNLILNKEIKEDYINKKIEKFNSSNASKYLDLCNNNTNVNFINFNIETQDDVSYLDCRKKCSDTEGCVGFSYQNINGVDKCNTYDNMGKTNVSMLYYDCNKSLTNMQSIGEIKNNTINHTVDLIDNNLYFIKSSLNNKYITFDKNKAVYHNENFLKLEDKTTTNENIYNNNIFQFKLLKENLNNGNSKFLSLLTDNKHILGSYKYDPTQDDTGETVSESINDIIKITYDKLENKYVWNHVEKNGVSQEKWLLENTNDIYEYVINKGFESGKYYCKYYDSGYKTMKVNKKEDNTIESVMGPGNTLYKKMYTDKNTSIFNNISTTDTSITDTSTTDTITMTDFKEFKLNNEGNIFIVKDTFNSSSTIPSYFIFTLINDKKYYMYNDISTNLIKMEVLSNELTSENSAKYSFTFEKYQSEISSGYSYQKVLVGGDDLVPEQLEDKSMKGGIKKDKLNNNNSYYIKSIDDQYLCANKHYEFIDEDGIKTKPSIIAVSIDSKLALNPTKNQYPNQKFVRASINLQKTKYGIYKNYNIDDDILWKLNIIQENSEVLYKLYNVKHNIYLNINGDDLKINITDTTSPMYYHLEVGTSTGSNINKLIVNTTQNSDKVYKISIDTSSDNDTGLFTFVRPEHLTNINPYNTSSEFSKLENGKIYRILNQGVKDINNTNTYLTINELNNELLIPYNDKLFTNNLSNDPTLWKCIINADNTYSFICMYNNQKLGTLENKYSLLKNPNNKLDFKNKDLIINNNYLTDKFYVEHNTNDYYNIINSTNLSYYLSGFSNNKNSYDNYELDNVKFTHKVANNSEWLLSCVLEETSTDTTKYSNEVNYYLYSTKTNKLKYSLSHKYNDLYNTIYYETSEINTNNNNPNKVIEKFKNSFMRYTGFTLHTNINCNPLDEEELKNYGNDNVSIILSTPNEYYTIRFINYKKNVLLIRINSNTFSPVTTRNTKEKQLENNNKSFNKLDFKKERNNLKINMNLIAPDIYSDIDFFSNTVNSIHLTYDKEFLNIYVNNKLITFTRILNTQFDDIYFTSNNNTNWTDNNWYKHKILYDIPLWKTENIDNFKNNKPGIRFTSKVNKDLSFEASIIQKEVGVFYIKNVNNEYLALKNKVDSIYDVDFIKDLPVDERSCLWKLYDTNVNKVNKIKILENKKLENNVFKINKNELADITNVDKSYFDDIYNSTNVMLKARINTGTKQVDEASNYMRSVIDIENTDSIDEKICSWLHNRNGHTSIDYNSYLIGSHFTTDLWNYQYMLGVDPQVNDTFYVKYKNNKGIIKIDKLLNEDYSEYGITYTTAKARWQNYEEIKEFSTIKSQNNIYVDSTEKSGSDFNNACIRMNEDRSGAICSDVRNKETCYDTPNSLLYMENTTCKDVLYKNYKLLTGEKMSGGSKIANNKQSGGNIWYMKDKSYPHLYLNNMHDDNIIFNNKSIQYTPSFDETQEEILNNWKYTDIASMNTIINRIFTTFEYDGYIIDEETKLIRGIIIPSNFVIFTSRSYERKVYVKGRIKAFSIDYKSINLIESNKYFDKYDTFYVNIKTISDGVEVIKDDTNNTEYKLNKCYDLIKKGICIPIGNNNTSIGNNINNYDFLKSKYDKFKDPNNKFRIASIYGKYLCDLYVNNTHYCNNVNISSIIFQGQFNSVNFEKDKEHLIHTPSYESLWNFDYDEDKKAFKIISSYTNKSLEFYDNNLLYSPSKKNSLFNKLFYIEYIESKYFKQQFINKDTSHIKYNNEDLYYIYYKKEGVKYYLSYTDIVVNNVHNRSAKVEFISETNSIKKMPFIVKVANYNLDILTDENKELPQKLINMCYNKIKTCSTNSNIIPLVTNKLNYCINMKYKLYKKNNSDSNFSEISKSNLYNMLIKNKDNFLRLDSGTYELRFIMKNVIISEIEYAFQENASGINIKLIVNDQEKIEEDIISNNVQRKQLTATGDVELKIMMTSSEPIILKYIEIFGEIQEMKFSNEEDIFKTIKNNSEPIKINKSLISKKDNIENNIVRIKYLDNSDNDMDNSKNIISFENTSYKPVLNDISIKTVKHKFVVMFNSLLNLYSFYIEDNKFLHVDLFGNTNDTGFYKYNFKLIESSTLPKSFSYKIFNIQNYDNPNLYLSVKNNKIVLGTLKHDFIFINSNTDITSQNIITYNNLINNNVLFTPYIKSVYINGVQSIDKYYYIAQNKLQMDSNEKRKLILKQQNESQYLLIDTVNSDSNNNYYSVLIDNFVNLNENTYMFSNENISHDVIINLFDNMNNLKIKSYTSHKKTASFNDVNKDLDNTNKYNDSMIRNKKYRSHEYILNEIILENIIVLNSTNKYLSANGEDNIFFSNIVDENSYFVEIDMGNNLYKLWNHKFNKFIKYDLINDTFKLDTNSTLYNNIDLLDNIDSVRVFEKIINTTDNTFSYKLYYSDRNTYLNPENMDIINSYVSEKITELDNYNYATYDDYCNKICNSSSYLEDKLIMNKFYNIKEETNQLFLTLKDYSINITKKNRVNKKYFDLSASSSIEDRSFDEIPLKNIQESHNLIKIFASLDESSLETESIKVLIVTVNINDSTNDFHNIILWKYNEQIIGRFENIFNAPKVDTTYIDTDLKIVYDSNFAKMDFSNNKSYRMTSYTNPPENIKVVKISKFNQDILKKYNISLLHYNNNIETITVDKKVQENKLSNIRKLYTTCSWGNCENLDSLSPEQIDKVSTNLKRFELTNKLTGGMLDNNMIRLIKSVSNKNIDFYNNTPTNKTKYVNQSLTYYTNSSLPDLLFKENDSVEVHKIFGKHGWTNSHNSYYHKTIFKINKTTNIKDIDYYDTFRNIYPVSYLNKTYAFNSENLWKSNNWFEDSPHFRSLPLWKFEEVQITENVKDSSITTLEFTGGNKGKKNNYNMTLIFILLFVCFIIYIRMKKY